MRQKRTKNQLIKILKDFRDRYARGPSRYDIKKGRLPALAAFKREFGSFDNALASAGMTRHVKVAKGKTNSYKDPVPVPEGTEKVLMGNEVFLYKAKAPFPASGYSFKGALELNDVEDKIKCHECGRWYKSLVPSHIFGHGGMKAKEYKTAHGLSEGTALCCESTRSKLIRHGKEVYKKGLAIFIQTASDEEIREQRRSAARAGGRRRRTMEQMNLEDGCPDQLLDKMQKAARVIGRTPTKKELLEFGVNPDNVRFTFGSMANAMKILGLNPLFGNKGYSKEQLLQMLSRFYKEYERPPSYSDFRRGLLPSFRVFKKHFGGWREALVQAQLPYREGPQVRDNAGRFR